MTQERSLSQKVVDADKPWYQGLLSAAEYFDSGILVITFLRLVDELWEAIVGLLNRSLSQYSWSSPNWLKNEPDTYRSWRQQKAIWSPMHDGLWGFTEPVPHE